MPRLSARSSRSLLIGAAFAAAAGLAVPVFAQNGAPAAAPADAAPAGPTAADGIFSQAQVDRTEAYYNRGCGECHGQTLGGSASAPPLMGFPFTNVWKDRTAFDLYTYIRTFMPATEPGTVSAARGADLVAYILSHNGYPVGEADLAPDEAMLMTITIGDPPAAQ